MMIKSFTEYAFERDAEEKEPKLPPMPAALGVPLKKYDAAFKDMEERDPKGVLIKYSAPKYTRFAVDNNQKPMFDLAAAQGDSSALNALRTKGAAELMKTYKGAKERIKALTRNKP